MFSKTWNEHGVKKILRVPPPGPRSSPFTFTCTFTSASASHFRLKFFISLYLLTMLMDQVDTLHVARYWSEVLRSTIMTHPG